MLRQPRLAILGFIVLLLVLATAGSAFATLIYSGYTGPTIISVDATTWTVGWTLAVTTFSNPDRAICLSTTPQGGTTTLRVCTPPNPSGVGTWTCQAQVSSAVPVAWNISSYPGAPGEACAGTVVTAGPSGNLSPLAVEMAGLETVAAGANVALRWETVSETANAGFNVYRSEGPSGERTLLAFVAAQAPGASGGARYEYVDEGVTAANPHYWVESVGLQGERSLHGPVEGRLAGPNAVKMAGLQGKSLSYAVPTLVALLVALGGWGILKRRQA